MEQCDHISLKGEALGIGRQALGKESFNDENYQGKKMKCLFVIGLREKVIV